MDIIYHKIKENYGYAKPYKESLHTHTLSLSLSKEFLSFQRP